MRGALIHLGMLAGVLLAVAGIVVALLTGFEPLYGGAGLFVAAGGGALSFYCRRWSGAEKPKSGPERSRQAPQDPGKPQRKGLSSRI